MPFNRRIREGILSYIYHKIAQDGRFVIRLPEDFLKHILNPFLSYYMSQVHIEIKKGAIIITGSSLVPVKLTLKTPIIREEEIIIPLEMNHSLSSFISTFGNERLKPLKFVKDSIIIPTELIDNLVKDITNDLKIADIQINDKELLIEIASK